MSNTTRASPDGPKAKGPGRQFGKVTTCRYPRHENLEINLQMQKCATALVDTPALPVSHPIYSVETAGSNPAPATNQVAGYRVYVLLNEKGQRYIGLRQQRT